MEGQNKVKTKEMEETYERLSVIAATDSPLSQVMEKSFDLIQKTKKTGKGRNRGEIMAGLGTVRTNLQNNAQFNSEYACSFDSSSCFVLLYTVGLNSVPPRKCSNI